VASEIVPMDRFDKLLSYFYPLIVETAYSNINPLLEVVYRDGKYMLNSANANYSYGGLYDLFKLIFKRIPIDWKNTSDILILGFGVGCTVPLIKQYSPESRIVGVEADEKVLELGRKYFDIDKLENTLIIHDTALNYVQNTKQYFDLAIIDVYIDLDVPHEVETKEFLLSLKDRLRCNGLIIFNKLTPSKGYKHQIPVLKNIFFETFGNVEVHTMMNTGNIFVSKRFF
jgi:spermidine synthase